MQRSSKPFYVGSTPTVQAMIRIPEEARFRAHKYYYVCSALRALGLLNRKPDSYFVKGVGWYVPIAWVKAVLRMKM